MRTARLMPLAIVVLFKLAGLPTPVQPAREAKQPVDWVEPRIDTK